MKTKRTTKSALISSVLALCLCITMLLGTTYAWFTDSVESANNIIKSGNLDVELYHTNDKDTREKVDNNTTIIAAKIAGTPLISIGINMNTTLSKVTIKAATEATPFLLPKSITIAINTITSKTTKLLRS